VYIVSLNIRTTRTKTFNLL